MRRKRATVDKDPQFAGFYTVNLPFDASSCAPIATGADFEMVTANVPLGGGSHLFVTTSRSWDGITKIPGYQDGSFNVAVFC